MFTIVSNCNFQFCFSGIQKLVLAGRMGEAIDTTHQLYPGLLDRRANLLFMLKCRQFIEMVNGTDSEVRGAAIRSPKSHGGSGSSRSSPSMSPSHHGSGYSYYAHRSVTQQQQGNSAGNSPNRNIITKGHSSGGSQNTDQQQTLSESDMNAANTAMNGSNNVTSRLIENEDVEMSDGLSSSGNGTMSNGTAEVTYANGNTCDDEDISEEMGKYLLPSSFLLILGMRWQLQAQTISICFVVFFSFLCVSFNKINLSQSPPPPISTNKKLN